MSAFAQLPYTPGKIISAATTNLTQVKVGSGYIGSLCLFNLNATQNRYLKVYDSASPTVGTTVPVQTYPIPANTGGSGSNIPLCGLGLAFANGIAFAITANLADNDATAIAAGEVVVNYGWN